MYCMPGRGERGERGETGERGERGETGERGVWVTGVTGVTGVRGGQGRSVKGRMSGREVAWCIHTRATRAIPKRLVVGLGTTALRLRMVWRSARQASRARSWAPCCDHVPEGSRDTRGGSCPDLLR